MFAFIFNSHKLNALAGRFVSQLAALLFFLRVMPLISSINADLKNGKIVFRVKNRAVV